MAIYDVGLFVGHGEGDPGACANGFREYDLNKKIVEKALNYIGDRLKVHTGDNNYNNNYTANNTYNLKYCMSIHINSGGGYGSEIYVPLGEKYLDSEVSLLKEFEKLGLKNRGIKSRDYTTEKYISRVNGQAIPGKTDYYKEIRQAWNKNSLSIVEIGFIDTSDIHIINSKVDEIAFAIAKELCKLKGIVLEKPVVAKATYRVIVDGKQIGAYTEIKNVVNSIDEATKKEFRTIEVMKI